MSKLEPTCDECGKPLDPKVKNCQHVENALLSLGVDEYRKLARRIHFMEGQIALLGGLLAGAESKPEPKPEPVPTRKKRGRRKSAARSAD